MKDTWLTRFDRKQRQRWLKWLTHIAAWIPLAWLYVDFYTFNLGSDEIRAAILRTGKPALVLLVLSLAVTPLIMFTGWNSLQPLRKLLGLYAFMYVAIHLAIFAVIDYGLDLRVVWEEIVLRRYALAGFASFLILLPLALTSTRWSQRKLGKRWKPLHRLVYLAGILAVIHYLWLVKQDYGQPIFFAVVLTGLLILRLTPIKKAIASWRRRVANRSG